MILLFTFSIKLTGSVCLNKTRSSLIAKSVFQKLNLCHVLQIYQHFHHVGTTH